MLYVTGDIHGKMWERLSNIHQSTRFTEDDYLVFCGDWGIVFDIDTPEYIKSTLEDLRNISLLREKHVVILGNHDNYDWALKLPKIETEIGWVRQCVFQGETFDNIYIVAEPTVLEICGERCFCIPGAECHDDPNIWIDSEGNEHSDLAILNKNISDPMWIYNVSYIDGTPMSEKQVEQRLKEDMRPYRVKGQSWWPQEPVNVDMAADILRIIKDNDIKIDFVLSHDCPAIVLEEINKQLPKHKEPITKGELFLERVRTELDFEAWFHGHLHIDRHRPKADGRVICLYPSIFCLTLGEEI